jgi:hypothetical protein
MINMEKIYEVKVDEDATRWYLNGEYHREDGPAIEFANGDKLWYINGQIHRVDGPAIEWTSGTKQWYRHGKCHREDGPAIEWANGIKFWYLNGEELREEEFNQRLRPMVGKEIIIDGIKYILN